MEQPLHLEIDRAAKTSLAEQIRTGIEAAIESGILVPGARLPSWLDLAAQLGVARGTVRVAYEKLAAAQFVVASRTAGTRVADRPHMARPPGQPSDAGPFMETYREMTAGPAVFQMGVPGPDTFPATLFARIRAQAVRAEASAPALYPDPRGEPELRREIAAYLALARGVACSADQVLVTAGFAGGLGLTLRALRLEGRGAWVEDPGFPFTRHGLRLAGLTLVPVPVDADGIDVDRGRRFAPDAALAVVTPGQQAPLGVTLSLGRRLGLLDWANAAGAWVIEDDYLGELQLGGRAAPALASLDRAGRVIHIGSFSKTLSPALRLGFVVVPAALVPRFAEVAACLAPAPGPSLQTAVAAFMREGHYMRHLRRTKRVYSARRDGLLAALRPQVGEVSTAGLAALVPLARDAPDPALAKQASAFGLAPMPLSPWYAAPDMGRPGLLLGIATAPRRNLVEACERLGAIMSRFRSETGFAALWDTGAAPDG
ncbi:PLP-dependent aminotransferase family protein [Methylobacterium sp. C1]|uniref:MocR-like pyridoxine biosynthesis transcription factor PdxR n=1 Tax=Methylobacterium sp. C1 TaxID=1479019 RepID=UPI0008DA2CFF|nr:PLP-dependent aminotransferase family protein [Methylobacterium sp. C1]